MFFIAGEYTWNDHIGNPGLLHSACLEGAVDPTLSVKLTVHYQDKKSVSFTCNCKYSLSLGVGVAEWRELVSGEFVVDDMML